MRCVFLAVTCSLAAACSDDGTKTGSRSALQQPAAALPVLEHDFGTIPHPESREHEFVVDPTILGGGFVPLRTVLDCSCGRAEMRIRRADGSEFAVEGSPMAENALRDGDKLIVRVILETALKESVDIPYTSSRGNVILQRVNDPRGHERVLWPLLLRYAIDSPVLVRPFAALDFARVPMSGGAEVQTTMRGDEQHPGMRFLSVTSSDPAIEVSLQPEEDHVRLIAKCRPTELGNHRALVTVTTDDPSGYRVNFATTWKVVPDLEATPMAKITFRADLSRAQTEDEAKGQFVVVTDHDTRRGPEFTVVELVDADSRDAAAHFAVTLSPIPGRTREHRLHVRYVGGRAEGFRGRLVLTKPGGDGPFLPIELVMFPTRDPK